MAQIGVIYLCRYAEGERPVRTFVESYRTHPAGADHDLHVIFKGFPDQSSLAATRALFGELVFHPIELDDKDYDIGSYFAAARLVSNSRLIFFNTFTELLADGWLKKLDDALNLPGVGLVGATGSWQSHRSFYQASWKRALYWIRHPLSYVRRIEVDRLAVHDSRKPQHADTHALKTNGGDVRAVLVRIGRSLYSLLRFDHYLLPYAPYPNPHIRTNAFMVDRGLFLSLQVASLRTKFGVYEFESGRRSLTQQIMMQNLRPVVVGRNGDVYGMADWKTSRTFWIDSQSNLLIADNRTRDYSAGSDDLRILLEFSAWVNPSLWPRGWPLLPLK